MTVPSSPYRWFAWQTPGCDGWTLRAWAKAHSFVSCANVSAYDIEISGNRGHSAIRSQASSRVFIGKVYDHCNGYIAVNSGGNQLGDYMEGAGQYHGCGVSKQSMGAVIWNVRWGRWFLLWIACYSAACYFDWYLPRWFCGMERRGVMRLSCRITWMTWRYGTWRLPEWNVMMVGTINGSGGMTITNGGKTCRQSLWVGKVHQSHLIPLKTRLSITKVWMHRCHQILFMKHNWNDAWAMCRVGLVPWNKVGSALSLCSWEGLEYKDNVVYASRIFCKNTKFKNRVSWT